MSKRKFYRPDLPDMSALVAGEFDRDALKRVCEMHETEFVNRYEMSAVLTKADKWWDADYPAFYAFLDRGADILAVAHLDTVMAHERRTANFVDTADGPVVYSGALDDRLGAYTILELLPRLGINVDVLLTTGEESGASTAQFFESREHHDREYQWMIEFDRGGTDVVMYQYEDDDLVARVEDSGARVGSGSFSDVAFLEHLEVKGLNWGVGYQDYHGPRSHAFLEDYWQMIGHYLHFHAANAETYLPHEQRQSYGSRSTSHWWDDEPDMYGITDDERAEHESHTADEPDYWCPVCDEEFGGPNPTAEDDDLESEDFNVVNERLLSTTELERSWR